MKGLFCGRDSEVGEVFEPIVSYQFEAQRVQATEHTSKFLKNRR